MPDSGGGSLVPCAPQGHVRSYSTVKDTFTPPSPQENLNHHHGSGTWMEYGVPPFEGVESDFNNQSLDNSSHQQRQVRGHGQFVTVVAVEKDENIDKFEWDSDMLDNEHDEKEEESNFRERKGRMKKREKETTFTENSCDGDMDSSNRTCHAQPTETQPVPKATPRGFVTVVAVGADTKMQLNNSDGIITANLELRFGPREEGHTDYISSESDYVNQEMIDREIRELGFKTQSQEEISPTSNPSVPDDTPSSVPDQVVVYRLPGERLGLGLKFDGGMAARECVNRLFIQSVAPDSPAARAAVPWGELHPGDQILNIEGCAVSSMTRVQCVSFLKDAAMKITIGVLKGNGILPEFENLASERLECYDVKDIDTDEGSDSSRPPPLIVGEMRKQVPPPPLPPRSRAKKSPARPPKDCLPVFEPPRAFQDIDNEKTFLPRRPHYRSSSLDDGEESEKLQQWRESVLAHRNRPGNLEELLEDLKFHHPAAWALRRMQGTDSVDDAMPPIPYFYHDLVGEEDAMGPCESESDETNSSVSTVIDRLSLSSSTTVSRNSSFNAASASADISRFDLARALSPFEQLEKELAEKLTQDSPLSSSPNTLPRDEISVAPPIDRTTKPPSVSESFDIVEVEIPSISNSMDEKKQATGKMKMRPMKSFPFSLKGKHFSWQQGKTHERGGNGGNNRSSAMGRTEGFLKKHSKRPAPTPPPRSIDLTTNTANSTTTVTSSICQAECHVASSSNHHEESDNYIDMIAEEAKQGITEPVNHSLHKKNEICSPSNLAPSRSASLTLDIEKANLSSSDQKGSPEYLEILDTSSIGESKFSSMEFYSDIEEDINIVKRPHSCDKSEEISESDYDTGNNIVSSRNADVLRDKENDYVELVPTSQVKNYISCESTLTSEKQEATGDEEDEFQSFESEIDDNISDNSALNTSKSLEIAAQVDLSQDMIKDVNEEQKLEVDENIVWEGVPEKEFEILEEHDEFNTSPEEGEYYYPAEEGDSTYETESEDVNESDEEDEGSYVLEPNIYEESECFLSCSSPKVRPLSPPIFHSTLRRTLKLPSVIVSDANEMGIYEDLYGNDYSSIDDSPIEMLPISRSGDLVGETRCLPSVPEEDSGEQDETFEEQTNENAYVIYDDVISEDIPEDNNKCKSKSLGSEAIECETLFEDIENSEYKTDNSIVVQKNNSDNEYSDAEETEEQALERANRTISQGYKSKRLRHDLGELIRREMNLEDDVTVEVEEEEEIENLVECADEEELLLVMRALRQDQPGDKLRWLEDDSDEDDDNCNKNDGVNDGKGREDDKGKGKDEGKKSKRERKRNERQGGQREHYEKEEKKDPTSGLQSSPCALSTKGQRSAEDREVVRARALDDPQARSSPTLLRAPPQTPTSPYAAPEAAISPIWPAQTNFATSVDDTVKKDAPKSSLSTLNSLSRGTGRHPHQRRHSDSIIASSSSRQNYHQSYPLHTNSKSHHQNRGRSPSLSSSSSSRSINSDLCRNRLSDKIHSKAPILSEIYEVESFEESEETVDTSEKGGSIQACHLSVQRAFLSTTSPFENDSAREVIQSALSDTPDKFEKLPEVIHKNVSSTLKGRDPSKSNREGSRSAMVVRTDTKEGAKAAVCPNDLLQSLCPVVGKQDDHYSRHISVTSSNNSYPSTTIPSSSSSSSSSFIVEVPVSKTDNASCSHIKELEEGEEGIESSSSSDSIPLPPNYATHPACQETQDIAISTVIEEEGLENQNVVASAKENECLLEEEEETALKFHNDCDDEAKEGEENNEYHYEKIETNEEEDYGHHNNKGSGSGVSVSSCEHRYTSSGKAPPPYSRLPPDGHEFPSNYAEGVPDRLPRYARYSRLAMELDSPGSPTSPTGSSTSTPRTRSAPGTPLGPPPPIPRNSPTNTKSFTSEKITDMGGKWTGGDERKSREHTPTRARWRRQDERSERSVRDKIAMFSTDGPDQPHSKTRKLDKVNGDEFTIKRAFTEDDVRLENCGDSNIDSNRDSHNGSRTLNKTSAFSSMINVSTSEAKDNIKMMSTASSEVDIRQDMTPVPRHHDMKEEKRNDESSSASNGLHSRSQSLIDIGRTSLTKRHSVGAYDRPSVYQYGIEKPEERERRTSLSNLIEQRRKSISKLRGLVIPESRTNEGDKAAIDLPKISSVPPSTNLKTMSLPREGQRSPRLYKADSISSIDSCESNTSRHSSLNASPWKNNTSTLPKYSPALKKKNITGYKNDSFPPPSGRTHSTRSTSPTSDLSQASPIPPTHTPTPPRSLETITTPNSEHSFEYYDRYSNEKHSFHKIPLSQKSSFDSRLSRAEDSDNDSAVSSTQSSFSQGISPPSSPMPDHDDQDDRRYRSYRSRLSPQSSFDEQEAARRVLKRGSIEAENRRNVLNSARCSSGRSSDDQCTPEIMRKFSSDRVEETDKFPQRLDSELRDGPKTLGLRRNPSTSSNSSAPSSRRSSHDSSRRNSRETVIHVAKHEEVKVSAEPVYFDQEGEMYKESQVKVAYLNEIMDDFEQLNESSNEEVIAEIPMSSRRVIAHAESVDSALPSSRTGRKSERWAALEMKYGSSKTDTDIEAKINNLRRASDSISPDRTRKNSNGFRALAERWQQRAVEENSAPQSQLVRRESTSRIELPIRPNRLYDERGSGSSTLERPLRPSRLCDDNSEIDSARPSRPTCLYSDSTQSCISTNVNKGCTSALDIPRADVPDRKLSMPEYGNSGIKMRERREVSNGGAPSRPTSLIEGGEGVMDSHYLTAAGPLSPTISTDSRDELLYTPEDSLSRTGSKEVLDAFSRPKASIGISVARSGASHTPKISEIMRALEKHDLGKKGNLGNGTCHPRMSSLDSTTSDDGSQAHYGSVTSLASQRDQYGSITSLASSTSLISPQELAQLIEEANQSLEESGTPSHEILVVVLHREIVGHGSIGITLAGGADYEAKEITVHKVIPGSLSDRDGRIQRGDRVLSINGKNLKGVTHREALNILKSPRPEVVLVLSRSRSVTPQESNLTEPDGNFAHRPLINHVTCPRPPKILESPMDSKSLVSDAAAILIPRGPPFTITLIKDGAGLGFSLEGGKDSPLGDRPLTVKKIFSGGAADKGGILKVGDELVSVNTVDVTGMARIEAWNFLKKLPDGTVSLVLKQKLEDDTQSKSEE